jgi:hypothetical protein
VVLLSSNQDVQRLRSRRPTFELSHVIMIPNFNFIRLLLSLFFSFWHTELQLWLIYLTVIYYQ